MNQEQPLKRQQKVHISSTPINFGLSSYQSQYYQLLQAKKEDNATIKVELIQKLSNSNIKYSEFQFNQNIKIKIIRHSFNFEVLALNISYGCFQSQISIVNLNSQSQTYNLKLIAQGNHGSIFKTYVNNRFMAIKCIQFDPDNFIETIKLSIKEYFILKIAFFLGIGPQVTNIYGFDLAIFRNSIEFSMQLCGSYPLYNNQELKQKLHSLHLLKIIHFDVKPSNIGYSYMTKSFVFLDFGVSRIIKEQIGSKTFTKFNGTYKYCSEEMANIFLNNQAGLADLYYNDAICLINSIRTTQSTGFQDQIEDYEEPIIHNIAHDRIIKLLNAKYILYSVNFELISIERAQLHHYQSTIRKFNLIMRNFLKNLPIPLAVNRKIINLVYTNINSKDTHMQIKDKFLFKHNFENINHNQVFIYRSNVLNHLDLPISPLFYEENCLHFQINILKNQELVKKIQTSRYHLLLINFIKINGKSQNFNQTKQICQVFIINSGKDIQFEDADNLYKYCFRQILFFTLNQDKKEIIFKYQILKSIIQTTVILELITQEQLIKIFQQILKSDFILVEIMSLIIQIIISLEFINQKIVSTYGYQRLKEYFNLKFTLYLSDLQTRDKKERLLIKLFNIILEQKLNILNQFYQISREFQEFHLTFVQKQLISRQIRYYAIYLLSYTTLINEKIYRQFMLELHMSCFQNNFMNEIYYYSFISYYLYYLKYNFKDCRYIFSLFQKRIGHFKQFKNFKITLLNIYSKLYHRISQQSILLQFQHQSQQKIEDGQKSYIIKTHKSIIDHNPNFHQHLNQFFKLSLLIDNNKYKQIIKEIIEQNMQKILVFPIDHQVQNYSLHVNSFKYEISFVMHVLFFIQHYQMKSQSEVLQIYQQIQNKVVSKLQLVQCFKCKILSLLQLKQEQIKFLLSVKYQKAIQLLIQIIAMSFKHHHFNAFSYKNLSIAMVISIRNKYLVDRNNIFQLIYYWLCTRHLYEYCLIKNEGMCSFLFIYTFIVQKYDIIKLATFIANVVFRFWLWDSALLINSFYQSVTLIINEQKQKPYFNYFVCDHKKIILFLINHHSNRIFSYLSLYFIVFLSINFKERINHKMIIFIAKYIDYLDGHSKKIILRKYYGYFLTYFSMSQRKRAFITKLHIKNMQKKLSGVKEMVKKMKLKSLIKKQSQFNNKMMVKLQNYHRILNLNE